MTNKILVTGATGTIGKAVIKSLQTKHASFIAGVREKETAKEKLGGVDLVKFDFSDASTFEEATTHVDSVFLLGPPLVLNLVELLTPFIDFLKRKKIMKVVYVSALGLEHVKELPFHSILEKKLADDGFDFTILKLSFFAQNFKTYDWENVTQRHITYAPAGTGKVAFVDVNDIGEAAAAILTSGRHAKKTYVLTGPELLSYFDAATILSDVTGKTITYPNPSAEEYTGALKAAGVPDFVAPYMISVYSMIANNHVNIIGNDIEKLTGRKPNTLRNVLSAQFS